MDTAEKIALGANLAVMLDNREITIDGMSDVQWDAYQAYQNE